VGLRKDDAVADLRAIFDDLVRFETVMWGEIDARLRLECAVSLGSLNAMMVIDSTPGCRVYDIARALAITVGGTSQAVDRLDAAGWSVRRANPADRRSSIVELTDEGKVVLANALVVFDEELDRLIRLPLSATALAHLAAALHTVRNSAPPRESP
jgi:DNA-binding MarR family transcriptional regulator